MTMSFLRELIRNADGGAGGAGGSPAAGGAAGGGAAGGAPGGGAAGGSAPPWHQGVDAEILGTWQNKSWDMTKPETIAVEATKAAIAAQKLVGVPASEIIRIPKPDDAAGTASMWQRLGKPAEAKDYDLSGVKFADGKTLEEIDKALADTIRNTLFENHVPKDRAGAIAQSLVKHREGQAAAKAAETQAAQEAGLAALEKNWGPRSGQQFKMNELIAARGAEALGLDQNVVNELKSSPHYLKLVEAFRKVGVMNKEDTFFNAPGGGGNRPLTVEGAQARLNELKADQAWTGRLLNNDAAAKKEFDSLTRIITGITEHAA